MAAWRKFWKLLLFISIAYVLLLVTLRLLESRFIFHPNYPDRLEGDWRPASLPVQDVWLVTSDGVKLHAWWIPAEGAKFTFLAFHGNAGNVTACTDVYKFLHQTPSNVLALEYRGYGRSQGTPSEPGLYRDADAAYKYLVQIRRIAPKSIISFGQSLGTAIAAHLAANSEVGGVILEAPFPSLSAMARRMFWFLPGAGFAVADQFQTLRNVQKMNVPILIVHCSQDPVVPADLAEEVFAHANQPKFVLRVAGECHVEAPSIATSQYRATLDSFLASIPEPPPRN